MHLYFRIANIQGSQFAKLETHSLSLSTWTEKNAQKAMKRVSRYTHRPARQTYPQRQQLHMRIARRVYRDTQRLKKRDATTGYWFSTGGVYVYIRTYIYGTVQSACVYTYMYIHQRGRKHRGWINRLENEGVCPDTYIHIIYMYMLVNYISRCDNKLSGIRSL